MTCQNIKCFQCHEPGHYPITFLHKKVVKNPLGGAIDEALASQFELDFTLIACMVTSMMGSVWYLDSEASFDMSRDIDFFMHIEMRDDERYNMTNIGIVTF